MGMFTSNIKITGKHAIILQKYCKNMGTENDVSFLVSDNTGNEKEVYLFETRMYCYMVAAMLGIINQKNVDVDSKDKESYSNIFADIVIKNKASLDRIYQFMILTENKDLDADSRVKSAFSLVPEEECGKQQNKLDSYVRGGLEIIDGMFGKCKSYEEICNKIFELKETFNLES